MHMVNLVVDHATGKRTRSANREVVDSFEECESLRRKTAATFGYIYSKQAKQRAINYQTRNSAIGQSTIRLGVDNDTRIAGTRRMYQHALRSRYTLPVYFSQESTAIQAKYSLTDSDFEKIAEFEAVISPICDLAFSLQKDSRPTGSSSFMFITEAKVKMTKQAYPVVDVQFPVDDDLKWDASTLYKKLPMKQKRSGDLGPEGQILHERLLVEMDRYFPQPDKFQLIAMFCDPVMMTSGIRYMRTPLMGQSEQCDRGWELFKKAIVDEANLLYCRSGPAASQGKGVLYPEDNDDDACDLFAMAMASSEGTAAVNSGTAVTDDPGSKAAEEIRRWEALSVDWDQFLCHQQGISPYSATDRRRVQQGHPGVLIHLVDTLLWWRLNAATFRLVSRVSARYMAKPDANSLQERVFSFCKLVDSPLRRRLGKDKFEMISILAFNKQYLLERGKMDSKEQTKQLLSALKSTNSTRSAIKVVAEFFEYSPDDFEACDDDENHENDEIAETGGDDTLYDTLLGAGKFSSMIQVAANEKRPRS